MTKERTPLHDQLDAPDWMTSAGLTTLREGYLLPGETVRDMFRRVAAAAARRLEMPELADKFYWAMDSGFFCLASPILANMGTDRGLPISCFGQTIGDSIYDIYYGQVEFAMLAKNGGGVSQYFGLVRPANAPIKGGVNGVSNGSIPFAHGYDAAVVAVSQGNVRRGANCFYWPATHGDRKSALKIRRQVGSEHLQCLNSNHAFVFNDETMRGIVDGTNKEDREFWADAIKTRVETGEPFLMFEDNANRLPTERLKRIYEKHGLRNTYSNICTEIILPGDEKHTFVCCISSLPIHRFREWRDQGVVRLMVYFLDAVLDEFIEKAGKVPGFERAVRFAQKSRAIGIGVLGYHSFLQNEGLPFNSLPARSWNKVIFRHIRDEAEAASRELAALRGEPEWCRGEGVRNTHLMAVAPTATNSVISGHVSPGIEPWPSNVFAHKTAKGTFMLQNPALERLLGEKGLNTPEVWKNINAAGGSVQGLEALSPEEKEVFLTAGEMDMRDLVDAAADRQEFIDQGQSVNLFFYPPEKGEGESESSFADKVKTFYRYVNETHIRAWRKGLKTLYYCRGKAATKADSASRGHERKTIIAQAKTGPQRKKDGEAQESPDQTPPNVQEAPKSATEGGKAGGPNPNAQGDLKNEGQAADQLYDSSDSGTDCKFCEG